MDRKERQAQIVLRLKSLKPEAAVNTIRTYANSVLRIEGMLGTRYSVEELDEFLEALHNPTLARNLLTALIVYHENPERYRLIYDKWNVRANNKLDLQRKSKREGKQKNRNKIEEEKVTMR